YAVRAFTATLWSTACLGALATGAPEPARLRATIQRACRRLGGDPFTRYARQLVGAGLAVLRGDLDGAADGYRSAATGFEAVDMMLVAEAARWRLGELLGGDGGRHLIEQATATLSAEGIVRPDRVVAVFAPVPVDARRAG